MSMVYLVHFQLSTKYALNVRKPMNQGSVQSKLLQTPHRKVFFYGRTREHQYYKLILPRSPRLITQQTNMNILEHRIL